MSYVIRRTNGDTLSIVNDREVVANYSTKLIGRDTLSYGEILNNNFIHLLENNANVKTQAPNTPILGQSWFQYNANKRGRLSVCMDEEAQDVEKAIEQVLKDGYRTVDIMSEGKEKVSCSKMGDLIVERL